MSKFNDAVKEAEIKSDFNDSVRRAKGLPARPNLVYFPASPKTPDIEYEVDGEYAQDVWPDSFKFTPKIGDMVESRSGRLLKIKDIIHRVGSKITIKLGRETGGSTAIEGGGSNGDPF